MVHEIDGSAAWPAQAAGPAVAIGNFDGVHAGHRSVLDRLLALAAELHTRPAVLTFDPAPTAILAPQRHQPRILTRDDRVRLLAEAGVELVIVEPFTPDFAGRSAEWFATQLLGQRLRAVGIVVGYDFRFGHGRTGNVHSLRTWLPELPIVEVEARLDGGNPVSSSRIRKLVASGDVVEAGRLLGRPHTLHGPVVHGDHRGRTIGFPTANIANRVELLPARGVYAVRAQLPNGRLLGGVANVGLRPTFDGTESRVEVHLFDFDGDLYGAALRVDLVARIRDEARFESVQALIEQIRRDAESARAILS